MGSILHAAGSAVPPPAAPDRRSCVACDFAAPHPHAPDARECRLNPPVAALVPGQVGGVNILPLLPPCPPGHWCGKFEPRRVIQ